MAEGSEREDVIPLLSPLCQNRSKISQMDLPFKIGVSQARISQIEKGTMDYRVDTLIVILAHFDRQINFF
jgi:predicted transcriptional regulator